MQTSTVTLALTKSRVSSAALYAAIPPVIPRTILARGMFAKLRRVVGCEAAEFTLPVLHWKAWRGPCAADTDLIHRGRSVYGFPARRAPIADYNDLVMNFTSSSARVGEKLRFVRAFLCDPLHVGALTPASTSLGDRIGAATRKAIRDGFSTAPARGGAFPPASGCARLRILELGAGTGAVSRFISTMNPVLVERNDEWAALLRQRFPHLEIRVECATIALERLKGPVGVVSSIPMLNNPQADAIRALLTRKYGDGLIRFCVLYTYGWADPLAGVGFREGRREYFVTRSFPPASVWVYR